jgi:DUF4097 and DUF4098 domain-containing protein YvlB
MRRRSLAGPLLLVVIGVLFLIYNLRPELPISEFLSIYWPFLLIAWGVIRLVEVVVSHLRGSPQRSGLTGGEVTLIVFICLIGSAMFSAHRHGIRLGVRGFDMFGEAFDFPVSTQQPLPPAVRRVRFDHLRGNLRVTGSDAPEIRITGHKTIRSIHRGDAERADRQSQIEIVTEGDTIVVRTNQERVAENQRVTADLEVSLPRSVAVDMHGRSGDYEVSDITGDLQITSDRAGVRLTRIGGNARVDLRRSDLVRAVDIKGNLDLQGRGSDVELENITGQVTVNGSYSGALAFRKLAKPLHFESVNTDLRVEALPGEINMDLGGLNARDVIGPMRLVTKTKDVRISDFTNSLDLQTERGDIELSPNRMPLAKIDARSRSGRIELVLPAKASFQLEASTAQGDAVNDYGPPLQKETEGRSASLRGAVGKGPEIRLATQRGTVSVRKAGVGAEQTQL